MVVRKVSQRIPFTPSKTQAALLEQCFGARRFAYNRQVEAFNSYDKDTNPRPTCPNVTDMKNANEWLRDSPIPSNALSNAIMDFRKSRAAYFRKAQYGKNRPRFASKSDNVQSFRNSSPIRRMEGNRYPLSRKLGSVRIRRRDRIRYPLESLSSWTVKRENGVYYLVLLFNVDVQPKPPVDGCVGIDVGVKDFLTLSTGEKINYPDRLHQMEEKVRWERVTGRRAPSPTEPAARAGGRPRLSAVFVEWMMGLPEGWVTATEIGLSRSAALRALGNGVVPQQASAAVASLLERERTVGESEGWPEFAS